MAKRPVFVPAPDAGLVEERTIDFKWYAGFALERKRRSIESLHRAADCKLGLSHVLEVSTKSAKPLGVRLSAFNLYVQSSNRLQPILLEAAFQGSKVFADRGPCTDLYFSQSGREIKQYMKQFSNDELIEFRFEGRRWKLIPRTAFYDWLYIRALRTLARRDDEVHNTLMEYEGFTDIEFNPKKSVNCQARSCALYVALSTSNRLCSATTDPTAFVNMLTHCGYETGSNQDSRVEGQRADRSRRE